MAEVHQRPHGRKGGDPSLVIRRMDAFIAAAEALFDAWDPALEAGDCPVPSFGAFVRQLHAWRASAKDMDTVKRSDVTPLDFSDAAALRDWLRKLRSDIDDALAAGDDATRPPGERSLGRAMAR